MYMKSIKIDKGEMAGQNMNWTKYMSIERRFILLLSDGKSSVFTEQAAVYRNQHGSKTYFGRVRQ